MIVEVLIDKDGKTIPEEKAKELGIVNRILFVRDDAYVLIAPDEFRDVAYKLHEGRWTHFYDGQIHGSVPRPIEDYPEYTIAIDQAKRAAN